LAVAFLALHCIEESSEREAGRAATGLRSR
jgi:hypothetical protein